MHLTTVFSNLHLFVLRNNKRTELSAKNLFLRVDFLFGHMIFKMNDYRAFQENRLTSKIS